MSRLLPCRPAIWGRLPQVPRRIERNSLTQQPDATHRGLPGFPARAELCLGLLQGGRADPAKITIRVMAITSLETRLP